MTFIFMLAFVSCTKSAGNRQRYLKLYAVKYFKWNFPHQIAHSHLVFDLRHGYISGDMQKNTV